MENLENRRSKVSWENTNTDINTVYLRKLFLLLFLHLLFSMQFHFLNITNQRQCSSPFFSSFSFSTLPPPPPSFSKATTLCKAPTTLSNLASSISSQARARARPNSTSPSAALLYPTPTPSGWPTASTPPPLKPLHPLN